MEYEKIILELLARVQILEEKVQALTANRGSEEKPSVTTNDICEHIKELKRTAKAQGKDKLILISRDIHRQLDLKSRYPMVCNAMRQCMEEYDNILFQPPKGNSSTLEIEYKL